MVILDIAMPSLNGIEAAARINADNERTAVLILSMHSDEAYVLRALKASARGYLLKDSAESNLVNAAVHSLPVKRSSVRVSCVLADDDACARSASAAFSIPTTA
jgi:DNA-binding NarL/FixJ family response regulator